MLFKPFKKKKKLNYCSIIFFDSKHIGRKDFCEVKIFFSNPELLEIPADVWRTHGKYKFHTRPLTGGLTGTGDVYHPAKFVFKVFFIFSIH